MFPTQTGMLNSNLALFSAIAERFGETTELKAALKKHLEVLSYTLEPNEVDYDNSRYNDTLNRQPTRDNHKPFSVNRVRNNPYQFYSSKSDIVFFNSSKVRTI